MRIGSLFSGYGGLEEGVRAVLDGTVAWHCEVDPGPSKILAHRYPGVPNLGDITAVDWSQVEPVDVLTGGFPCQDVSAAGKRLGMKPGTRSGLWSHMAYAIDQLRPALVVAENVRGLLSAEAHSDLEPCPWCLGDNEPVSLRALGGVLGDLAGLGYDAAWRGLRAADVGAPHGRFRVFVVAWPAADASSWGWTQGLRHLHGREPDADRLAAADAAHHDGDRSAAAGASGGRAGRAAADTDRLGHERCRRARHGRAGPADGGRALTHAEGAGPQGPRPEPARRGPERSGVAAAHPDGDALRHEPVAIAGSGGAAVAGPASAAATPHPEGHGRHEGRPEPARLVRGSDASECGSAVAADADGRQRPGRERDAQRGTLRRVPAAGAGCGDLGGSVQLHDRTTGTGHLSALRNGPQDLGRLPATSWGPYAAAIHRWEGVLGRPAPAPTGPGAKGQPRLSPRFVEWMQGLPAGWVTDVPGLTRNEQLKALGNGVVPQQAAHALRLLLADLPQEEVA